jgi:thiosulfate reductase cytochrome b subunit
MIAGQQRKVQRVVHLAAAVVLLAYVYAPVEAQLQDAVRFMVFPLLTLTGIAMWQAPRIRRTLKAVRGGRDVGRHARSLRAERQGVGFLAWERIPA